MVNKQFIAAHVLLAALVFVITSVPNQKVINVTYFPLLVALAVIEGIYLILLIRNRSKGKRSTGPSDIVVLVWVLFLVWELASTKFAITPNVLVPTPEEVFDIFRSSYPTLIRNVISSTTLLAIGYTIGIALGVVLGIICGWIPRLREMFYPIANVLAPIPPTVFAPYLVVLMPSFRSASELQKSTCVSCSFCCSCSLLMHPSSNCIRKRLLHARSRYSSYGWRRRYLACY